MRKIMIDLDQINETLKMQIDTTAAEHFNFFLSVILRACVGEPNKHSFGELSLDSVHSRIDLLCNQFKDLKDTFIRYKECQEAFERASLNIIGTIQYRLDKLEGKV